MAFDARETEAIHGALDDLCSSRSPEHAPEIRMVYEVDHHSVLLFEERPDWQDPGEWMRTPIAKFRYYRSRDEWHLYWMRGDLKWHRYEPAAPARNLKRLVSHVDRDTYGCFFG